MKQNEITYTNQRVEILEFLKNDERHPTVEQVFDGVRKRLSRISKATVYQNLRFLSEKGLIREVNIKGVSRFEPNTSAHHHVICRRCGSIKDFESKELTDYSMKIARKLRSADIETTDTHFYGICAACKTGADPAKPQ